VNEVNKLELKLEAYKQSLASKILDYEDRIAELRVELTLQAKEIEELRDRKENTDVQEKGKNPTED